MVDPVSPGRMKVLACATVMEELLPVLPEGVDYTVLEYGLHLTPGSLKDALQAEIDASSGQYETIILGYGLCSMAVVGLNARSSRLVVPKVDDCIALFLGSREKYSAQHEQTPGTYYLTKGWIKVGDTILSEYERSVERFGEERTARIMRQLLNHYTRLVYIDTGQGEQEEYRAYARRAAEKFNLDFAEIRGDNTLVKKMLSGPWDDEFVTAAPGETISFRSFTANPDG